MSCGIVSHRMFCGIFVSRRLVVYLSPDALWEASWNHLGALLGPFWELLESSWRSLGALLGAFGALLGLSWGPLGGPLGALFGPSWRISIKKGGVLD